VPYTSERNEENGVYRTICCGHRILITAEMSFPYCPNHPRESAKWELETSVPGAGGDAAQPSYFWHSLDHHT
jgi:hypothetical protein